MTYVELPFTETQRLSFYLAQEEYIARYMEEDDCFFMWQVEPSVIFGRNQLIENEVNLEYCKQAGIQVYRRKSGGGCVYADSNNIMFSYINSGQNVPSIFEKYVHLVADALQGLGVDARPSGRNDIMIGNRKVSGNAFYHLSGRNIVHGTMLYDTDMEHMVCSITPSDEKLISKGVQSVRQHITLLKDYINLTIDEFKQYIRQTLCDHIILLDATAVARIREIEQEYLTPEFIYGNNPRSSVSKKVRIAGCGEMEARVELNRGIIRSVTLVGDFFPVGDLNGDVLSRLRGVPYHRGTVADVLEGIDMEVYIHNLTTEQLIDLIF